MNDIEKKVKFLLNKNIKRKDIATKLNISLYKVDQIKKRLIEKGEIIAKEKKKDIINQQELDAYKKVIDIISREFLNYGTTSPYFTSLSLRLKQMHENYSYILILKTINYCHDRLVYASNKTFNTSYQKVAYLCTIIKNNLEIVKKMEKAKQIKASKKDDNVDVLKISRQKKSKPTRRRDFSEFLED